MIDAPTSLERLALLARTAANAPALITPNSTISYRQYHRLVCLTEEKLLAHGIQPGERIGIRMANCWQYAVVLMAMLRLGVVAVPISTRFPAAQAERLLADIDVQKLIIGRSADFEVGKQGWTVIEIRELVADASAYKPTPSIDDTLLRDAAIDPQRDATVLFTSGSSGQPKAVLHTLQNHDFSAIGANQNMPFGSGDRWLVSLPLYHIGGLSILFRALHGGGAVVFANTNEDLAATLVRQPITHLSLVATQLYRLLKNSPASSAMPTQRVLQEQSISPSNPIAEKSHKPNTHFLKKLKALLLGGSAIPASLLRLAVAHRLPIFTTYGSTEMTSQITTTAPESPPEKIYTSGKPIPYREVRFAEDGEILVRGATRFKGYLMPTGLQKPFDADGWFCTGDTGTFDKDGYLMVKGRKDKMFISGGENIQPEEIEQALCAIDGIVQAVVVPVADAEFGQRPVAFVQMRAGASLNAEQIEQHLAQQIARFKIPKRILPWPENGGDMKISRR